MKLFVAFKLAVTRFRDAEAGATAIEYALIAALISIACIVGIQALGGSTTDMFENISAEVEAATPDPQTD